MNSRLDWTCINSHAVFEPQFKMPAINKTHSKSKAVYMTKILNITLFLLSKEHKLNLYVNHSIFRQCHFFLKPAATYSKATYILQTCKVHTSEFVPNKRYVSLIVQHISNTLVASIAL